MTFTRSLSTGNYGPAKFIVDGTTVANGTHSTIAAALSSATSGDTIFIRPGTYTENLTLKAGVNLQSFNNLSQNQPVIIKGKMIDNGVAISVTFGNITFQTNGDFILASTAASVFQFNNCYFRGTDATIFSAGATGTIRCYNSIADLETTGIAIYNTTGGTLFFEKSSLANSGVSVTSGTHSSGNVQIKYCTIEVPLATTSTGAIIILHSQFGTIQTPYLNQVWLTTAGTGTSFVEHCIMYSGTASSISVGAGSTVECYKTLINSTNTNSVTGAGTLIYSDISFSGTSSVINTTTQTPSYTQLGKWKASGQPCFLAYLASVVTNITGNGAVYTVGTTALTEVYDQDSNFNTNGTFTAPVTGRYQLNYATKLTGNTISVSGVLSVITSNRTYRQVNGRAASSQSLSNTLTVVADMDAADTVTCTIQGNGEVGDTDDLDGSATLDTYQSGCLLA